MPGVGQVLVFGAGDYAMRIWLKPDLLAKLGLTVGDINEAVQQQNTVNPAGQIGAEPLPKGQEMTYTVRSQGRLLTPEEFEHIVVRANRDGSVVRLGDVARPEDRDRPRPRTEVRLEVELDRSPAGHPDVTLERPRDQAGFGVALGEHLRRELKGRGLHLPPADRAAVKALRRHEHLGGRVLGRAAESVDQRYEHEGHPLVLEGHELLVDRHTRPSFIFPSSLIIDWFHGGSHVILTSASPTPGTRRILLLASSAIAGPIPHPGAVSVIATLTR